MSDKQIGEQVFFEKLGRIYKGIVEKELVNTYIVSVKTGDQEFNELYHGKIAISKKKMLFE